MTIETQINRVQFEGNGLARDFPVPFPVQRPEHLKLFLWRNNQQTRLRDGFTVLGTGTLAVTVSLGAPLPAGVRLTILREVPLVQPMDLRNTGPFNPKVLEGSADNLVMQIQQLAEMVGRAIVAPEGFPGERPDYNVLLDLKDNAEAARDRAREEADRAGNAAAGVRDELADLAAAAEKAQAGARLAKSQARAAATLARKWAANPEDAPVLYGLFSARHYAMKAAEAGGEGAPGPGENASAIPTGGIIMWSGAVADIPEGWALCDGENGTPDLRDRFIVGVGNKYEVGETGGSDSFDAAFENLATGAATLTTAQMPSHGHNSTQQFLQASGGSVAPPASGGGRSYNTVYANSVGGGESHAHPLMASAEGSNLPPYYALCLIMFIGG